jgi:hypothetical protein
VDFAKCSSRACIFPSDNLQLISSLLLDDQEQLT